MKSRVLDEWQRNVVGLNTLFKFETARRPKHTKNLEIPKIGTGQQEEEHFN